MLSKKVLPLTMLTLSTILPAHAATVAFTSFEEPEATGGQYTDAIDPATDHALVNNTGQPIVNYTSVGGELGFRSSYINTRDSNGLSDGDFVGVTDFIDASAPFTAAPNYTDGTQGFQIADADGLMRVELDAVTLDPSATNGLTVDAFLADTNWEADDNARIWVEVDNGLALDLFNSAGSDIDELGVEGAWMSLFVDLSTFSTATLFFELDSNSASEALFIDNINFDAVTPVPLPAAVWFLAAGFATLVGFGRRKAA